MSKTIPNYRDFLLGEFQRRKNKNPRFSWRAFAKELRLTSSRMSEIMKGVTGISVERAASVAEILGLSAEDQSLFIDLVEMEHSRNEFGRKMAAERVRKRFFAGRILQPEEFSMVSQWHFLPVLSLLETNRDISSSAHIAKHLGLDEKTAETALNTLEEMRLVQKQNSGWSVLATETRTVRGATSLERRNYNRKLLNLAEKALDTRPLEERSFTSGVVAVSKEQLPQIRERIRQFHLELMG